MRKCIYCGREVHKDSVIDFCDDCGKRVWGPKMFATIKQNMEDAKEKGDLEFNSCGLANEVTR